MNTIISTTKQPCFQIPSLKSDKGATLQDWDNNHRRVFIAYNSQELLKAKNGVKGHIQIVKKSKIVEIKPH